MGMYTELVLGFRTRNNELAELLKYMISSDLDDKDNTPVNKYPDLLIDRRRYMLLCSSYYFPCSESFSHYSNDNSNNWHVFSFRSSLKNYASEIEWFIEYLREALKDEYNTGERLMGYYRYEEDTKPTLIYM